MHYLERNFADRFERRRGAFIPEPFQGSIAFYILFLVLFCTENEGHDMFQEPGYFYSRSVLHLEFLLRQSGADSTKTVAIVGAGGGLGHLGCQFAKALGLIVVGIDAREEGLALAKESGADIVLDAREKQEKVVSEVLKVTNGMGAGATVNVSDSAQAAALACAVTQMQYVLFLSLGSRAYLGDLHPISR